MKHWMQIAAFAALLLALNAHALAVVDQVNATTRPVGVVALLAYGTSYRAQTVTTGITGNLVAVDLNVAAPSNFPVPWVLDIRAANDTAIFSTVLSSTIIPQSEFPTSAVSLSALEPFSLRVLLSTPVHFNAGERFAIVLHGQGLSGAPGYGEPYWTGAGPDPYPGGTGFTGVGPLSMVSGDYDLHFRTFVDSVPEPGVVLLVAIAAMCCVRNKRCIGLTDT